MSALSTGIGGYMYDRVNPKYIVVGALMLQSASFVVMAVNKSVVMTFIFAFVFGVSNGCMNNMSLVVLAYLFGE